MKRVLAHKKSLAVAAVVLFGGVYFAFLKHSEVPVRVTATVERGTVAEIISVSGVLKAESEATLTFPSSGIVNSIYVDEGDTVSEGQLLATLEQAELLADRETAYGDLVVAEANRTEAENGPRAEARTVTATTIETAKADLARTITEEAQKVENAYRALLASDLEAVPVNPDTDDVPPVVLGTYSCDDTGQYLLSVFRSSAKSGYSYKLSGLESGTYVAYTDTAAPFGSCGLSLKFSPDTVYAARDWKIEIPNPRGDSYVTNKNAYDLARKNEASAVAAAQEALAAAEAKGALENATPRSEAASRLDAAIIQAKARLAAVDARIGDRTLKAPFPGTVSAIEMTIGEVAPTDAMTIVADARYELTVKIPEIDITHLALGQKVEVVFDARPDEVVTAAIDFISKTATEIEGVAYFEAKIHFAEPLPWFRSGLNADVNVVVDARENVLKLPKRFITKTATGASAVLVPKTDTETTLVPVTTTFSGNDGFVAVDGVAEGTTVIAP